MPYSLLQIPIYGNLNNKIPSQALRRVPWANSGPSEQPHSRELDVNSALEGSRLSIRIYLVLVKRFILSYHNKETILFTIDPGYGNLNIKSLNKNPAYSTTLASTSGREALRTLNLKKGRLEMSTRSSKFLGRIRETP